MRSMFRAILVEPKFPVDMRTNLEDNLAIVSAAGLRQSMTVNKRAISTVRLRCVTELITYQHSVELRNDFGIILVSYSAIPNASALT